MSFSCHYNKMWLSLNPLLPLFLNLSVYIRSCFFSPLCSQTKKGKELSESTRAQTHTDIHNAHLLAAFSLPLSHTHAQSLSPTPQPTSLWFFFIPFLSLNSPPPPPPLPQPALASFLLVHHPSLSPALSLSVSPASPPYLCVSNRWNWRAEGASMFALSLDFSSALEWCKPDGNMLWPTVHTLVIRKNKQKNTDADNLQSGL